MSLTPEEQAELDALEQQLNTYNESQQAQATFTDVAPYFYNNQLPNRLNDGYSYETDLSDYVPGPGFFTYTAPLVGALTPSVADRLMQDKKLYPVGEDGKKIKGSDPIANPQQVLEDARSSAQVEFEMQRDLDADKLQKELDIKTSELSPKVNRLESVVNLYNDSIRQTNALTSQALSRGDTLAADHNQNQARLLTTGRDRKLAELNSLNAQIAEAEAKVSSAQNAQMTAAQAIEADTRALASMGVSAPDVSKELQAGDVDGARKKMADHLSNQAKSRMARLVDFTKQIKSGKQVLFDADGKFRPTKTIKGGAATGLGAGFLLDTALDFIGNESINLEEEERIVQDLIDRAERYSSPFSGPDQTLLNPKTQGDLIEDIKQYHDDPSGKGYLLNANRPRTKNK